MILPEDAPTSPLKGQSPDIEHGQQPPSYGAATNQAGGSTLPHLHTPPQQQQQRSYGSTGHPYQHVIVPPQPHHNPELDRQPRRNARRRFCKALFVAILIWFLATMLFGSMFGLRSRGHKWLDDARSDLPADVLVDQCFELQVQRTPIGFPSPNTAYTSFQLPVSEGLLVMARGSLSKGQLRVSTGGAGPKASHAKLEITVTFYRMDVLGKAQICKIHRRSGEVGVAILTPRWSHDWGYESRLHFDVNLSFHGSSSNSPQELTIKKLETDLPNFSHNIDNSIQNDVYFQDLVLRGSNGYILAESIDAQNVDIKSSNAAVTLMTVAADTVAVKTSNGIINGHYVANGTLKLETSNALIKVDVDLTASKRKAGNLFLKTSNSPVTADVNLHLYDSDKEMHRLSEHDFNFDARSSNGGLHLNVKHMPLDSRLSMSAKTSNGIVNTWLPPAFEGSFELSTSSMTTPVVDMEKKDDPWGRGRTRTASGVTNGRKQMTGNVYWGDKPDKDPKSSLTARTSNAPVTLYL